MSALTQLSTVKSRLGLAGTADDAILTRVINAVSERFERLCNRRFGRAVGATQEFDGDETEIRVANYPLESVALFELKSSESDGWQTITPAPSCVIRRDCVISLYGRLGSWRQRARVSYTGGYVLPGDEVQVGQTPLPEDIQQACVEQVACWYGNRDKVGISGIVEQVGTTTTYAQQDLLPSVQSALKSYVRWSV